MKPSRPVIIGGGPAGLMAAEILTGAGLKVDLYDAMPSLGRKFLMAGKSGLNLTHAEDLEPFLKRFGARRADVEAAIRAFPPKAIRDWARELGVDTFVGSSGRIFPTEMKAAPLLRAWLRRLRDAGLETHVRHRWCGWTASGELQFETPDGPMARAADTVVLALGGASWARLGSDAVWAPLLGERGVALKDFQPANCGFLVNWHPEFRDRHAGSPVKSIAIDSGTGPVKGDFVISASGVEGSAVYGHSARLRDQLLTDGRVDMVVDLTPDRSADRVLADLQRPRGKQSLSNHLRKAVGLSKVKIDLLRELLDRDSYQDSAKLAKAIKALPIPLVACTPMDEAISTAGGISFEALGVGGELKSVPGCFVAGEMLDWEAPTGGYLLTACLAQGRAAGQAALDHIRRLA